MTTNSHQPTEYDAVLGGQLSIPANAAVLGGIEGVKKSLASKIVEQKIVAISQALNYGEAGLDLIIRTLEDESYQVQKFAYLLLRERDEPTVKKFLLEYNPWKVGGKTCTFGRYYIKFESIHAIVIHPHRRIIVGGDGGGETKISVWDMDTKRLMWTTLGCLKGVKSFAISPDGLTLINTNNSNTIPAWNLYTCKLIRTFEGHSDWVNSVAITQDGKTMVSGSRDKSIQGKLI